MIWFGFARFSHNGFAIRLDSLVRSFFGTACAVISDWSTLWSCVTEFWLRPIHCGGRLRVCCCLISYWSHCEWCWPALWCVVRQSPVCWGWLTGERIEVHDRGNGWHTGNRLRRKLAARGQLSEVWVKRNCSRIPRCCPCYGTGAQSATWQCQPSRWAV
jgi:hypothetical protein